MHDVALVSSNVLRALPSLLLEYSNDRVLKKVFDQAGLSEKIFDGYDTYITQRSHLTFVQAVARELGEPQIGLLLAPHLSINNYGAWGKYILAGTTLQNALLRSVDVMKYYSTRDSITLIRDGDDIRFSHIYASAGAPGYHDVATGTAATMIDMLGSFLGHGWKPAYIELDVPNTNALNHIERVFGCPVRLGTNGVSVPVPIEALNVQPRNPNMSPVLTRADVVREARGVVPGKLPDIVLEIIRNQLADGRIGLEATAFDLQIGPRKLQRKLEKESTSYRNLVVRVRTQRAKELLLTNGLNITQISGELGYSSPTHFSRAFSTATGISPSHFRKFGSMGYQRKIDLS